MSPRPPSVLSEAMLGWFDDLAAQGIMTTDTNLKVVSWNHWLEVHSGRRAADVIGRPLTEAWPDLAARGFDQYYAAALAGQVRVVAQALHGYLLPLRSRAPALEHMPQSARIAPLVSGGRIAGTITVIDDVTERIVREDELRSQITALDAARATAEEAVRTKGEFLATLSHELRTPLNSILGWTRILRSSKREDPTVIRALEVIERNAVAQVRLIEDLLDMSRITTGKLRLDLMPIDPLMPVLGAVDVVAPVAAVKGVVIHTHLQHGLPRIDADADRLQQVVWNLLSNAVKFTDSGGTIELRLDRTPAGIVLTVADSGIGISREFLPHVFERFRQADPSTTRRHGGLGLGLALVRHLVELHGGTVGVESEGTGRGTTFWVRLPMSKRGTPSRRPAADAGSADDEGTAPLSGVTILALDDEPDAREFLRTEMERLGARVTVAAASAEALDILADRGDGEAVVVIADVGMPGEDGYTFIEKLRDLDLKRGQQTPAIAVTAYARPEDRARALTAGYDRHVAKPVDLDVLVRAVLDTADVRPGPRARGEASPR
ncbi:MAG TPA: ATP-binding protein [Candidatus Limnocylindria bacterium]|nr:ATP-binding protein [Candidatus Limnocylindria bacterium]